MNFLVQIRFFTLLLGFFLLQGCQNDTKSLDDLNSIKKDFIQSIFNENFDESPFKINYKLQTTFFSNNLISLFGEIFVYDHLPHGWSSYESKTFYKKGKRFQELTLADLFTTPKQREFLRIYCENALKKEVASHFSGEEPLFTTLDPQQIRTFVVNKQFLIIVFQPYSVGGGSDGPMHVKIPYEELQDNWSSTNPLTPILSKTLSSGEFTSSWDY